VRHLIRADKKKAIADLYYVEFDVHETADGELAVLHDLGSMLAASRDAEVNAAPLQAIRGAGIDLQKATVQVGQLAVVHCQVLAECVLEGVRGGVTEGTFEERLWGNMRVMGMVKWEYSMHYDSDL